MSLSDPLFYLPGLLAEMFNLSPGEVRRLLASGAVLIDGGRYEDHEARAGVLAGAEVRVGKRLATLPDRETLLMEYGPKMIHGGVS